MVKFESLSNKCKLSPEDLADLCERFKSKEMDEFQLAKRFGVSVTTIDRYLDTHYYGLVPKENQITIILKSKV